MSERRNPTPIITGYEIFERLQEIDGVITNSHLTGTSGKHLKEYFDLRTLFRTRRDLLERTGHQLGEDLRKFEPDMIIGPESLGRELAGHAAAQLGIPSVHLSKRMVIHNGEIISHAKYRKTDQGKEDSKATPGRDWELDEKLEFSSLFMGRDAVQHIAIVDDLLNTGGSVDTSIKFILEELLKIKGVDRVPEIIAAGAVIRRNPHDGSEVTAESLGVPHLVFLKDVTATAPLTAEQCALSGMCAKGIPMLARPGHGYEFLEANPDYPAVNDIRS
jgi:orotate phosphoribosyltransferase